jgi:nucleoside-diphosphate-sugar epimerase
MNMPAAHFVENTTRGTGITTESFLVGPDDRILITGATGFIGSRVVESLLSRGFRNLCCFVRPFSRFDRVEALLRRAGHEEQVHVLRGDLLSHEDCDAAVKGVKVIYHLAAGTGTKSFAEAVMNSVVTTRNLLDASLRDGGLRRFVNISSFTVYTNTHKPNGNVLDESCPIEQRPERRGDAYCYGKVKQDELVTFYGRQFGVPYVIARPGYVYGPGKQAISGRIGIDTFGFFLHMGGLNKIPLTYVDNCADAITLAGLTNGVDGEVFNIVDDELPSSRQFLRLYKKNVRGFRSLYLPHIFSYIFCWLWEWYSNYSEGQLPPTFNRRRWYVDWKSTIYNNDKLKRLVGWSPRVSLNQGLQLYFEACRKETKHA